MNRGAFPIVSVQPQTAFRAGGRLTLASGTPVISTDQTAKTVIYYTPFEHGAFPVIKNGVIRPVYFSSDLQLTMTSAFTGSGIFDLFGIERGGKGVLVAGVPWSVPAAGSGARGTTPGQSELIRVAGMNVNRWGMPGLSAENATYIEPLEGRYLGSVFVDAAAGQATDHVSYGQSRKRSLWNADNRRPIYLMGGDATATWTLSANTAIRSSNNAAANSLTVFQGLAEESYDLRFKQQINAVNATVTIGIGVNSVAAFSGLTGQFNANNVGGASFIAPNLSAEHMAAPILGISTISALERITGFLGSNIVFSGTNANMLLSALWQG